MRQLPSLSYLRVVRALQRDGWIVVRQRGSHIRMHKRLRDRTLKVTVPAHRPIKLTTLYEILKQCEIDIERFLELI